MRENAGCGFAEPIPTPTESTPNSSSSPKVRPVEEKKMRPPCASSWASSVMKLSVSSSAKADDPVIAGSCEWRPPRLRLFGAPPSRGKTGGRGCKIPSFFWQQAPIIALVIFRPHAVLGALALHGLAVFLPQERILHVIGDRRAAFRNIHRRVIGVLLAGRAGLAAGIVRPEPGGEAERFFRGAEMLVIPARAARRRRHHADRLIVDAFDFVHLAVLPRRQTEALGPSVGVALALDADQHRRRSVSVGLRVVAVLVLADPQIERIAGHERLDPTPARRAAIVERQVAIDDVGDEIRPPHGKPAHRIGLDIVLVFVEIVRAGEAVAELIGAVE